MSTDPIQDFRKGIVQKVKKLYTNSGQEAQIGKLAQIGKPCVYHNTIDPQHRISDFFKTRMNIIDLLPCHYKIDFSKISETDKNASGLVPQIVYDKAISDFYNICGSYGVPSVSGLRIYTIDDTQASDSIGNELKENYFQSGINKFSEIASPIRQLMKSLNSNSVDEMSDMLSDALPEQQENLQKTVKENTSENLREGAGKVFSAAKDVILKGHRITLPSIWSDSSYSPNFTANVRLASPYGHPKAVKEFVIKPLMYLLILASPETSDGVSYGQPFFVTLKGYGLNYSPIGVISNITLRRGGNDSSFNVFRQPLTIDVSLEFKYAVSGFAHYSSDMNVEENIYSNSDQPEYLSNENDDTALPTIGHIVKSLRPRAIDSGSAEGHSSLTHVRNTKPDQNENSISSMPFVSQSSSITPMAQSSQFAKYSIANSQAASVLASTDETAKEINKQAINSTAINNTFA